MTGAEWRKLIYGFVFQSSVYYSYLCAVTAITICANLIKINTIITIITLSSAYWWIVALLEPLVIEDIIYLRSLYHNCKMTMLVIKNMYWSNASNRITVIGDGSSILKIIFFWGSVIHCGNAYCARDIFATIVVSWNLASARYNEAKGIMRHLDVYAYPSVQVYQAAVLEWQMTSKEFKQDNAAWPDVRGRPIVSLVLNHLSEHQNLKVGNAYYWNFVASTMQLWVVRPCHALNFAGALWSFEYLGSHIARRATRCG